MKKKRGYCDNKYNECFVSFRKLSDCIQTQISFLLIQKVSDYQPMSTHNNW